MRKLIVDNRYVRVANDYFKGRLEIIPSPVIAGLPQETASHLDMGLVRVGDVFVSEPTVFKFYKKVLSDKTVLCGKTQLKRHYPNDIAYNVLISETVAFGNEAYLDPVLKDVLKAQGISLCSVKQGYAKCSCAHVAGCLITADTGIFRCAQEHGFRALLISPGDVALKGFDYGFLGGASGEIDDGLFFFGDITKHRDYEKIHSFFSENNIKYQFIKNFPLTDVGTVLLV